jgi:hypothetical protein
MRIILAIILLLTSACAGVSRIPLDEKFSGRQPVLTTISDPHALAPTTQRSWMELCDVTARQNPEAVFYHEWQHKFANCTPMGDVQIGTATGYVAGLMQPFIYAGAMVGSAFLIGDGLSKSGPTVNQSGGGATQSQQQILKGGHGYGRD